MIIRKVDIPNFGSFKGFNWHQSVKDSAGAPIQFKKINILYGRNYSGKTTLSRVIRSLEIGELPANYDTPEFSVTTDAGTITQAQIPSQDHIRVYNRDFVRSHLAFGGESEGDVTPFAIIGRENNTVEAEIAQIEKYLGSAEAQMGLRHRYAEKFAEHQQKQKSENEAQEGLRAKLRKKANEPPDGIKYNNFYNEPTYNITRIDADIETIRDRSITALDDDAKRLKEDLLKEEPLPSIESALEFAASLSTLVQTSRDLLTKEIAPTEPIQALINDAILQEWVREGIPHHKGKRDSCGFCGQRLPEDLWERLDRHFSKESGQLREELDQHLQDLRLERKGAAEILDIEQAQLYAGLHKEFASSKLVLDGEVAKYHVVLDALADAASARARDIFTPGVLPEYTDNTAQIESAISHLNALVERSDQKTESLDKDQQKARNELRLSEVAEFIQTIDLDGEETKVTSLRVEEDHLKAEVNTLGAEIKEEEKKISALQVQLKDEKKGADRVNEYLNQYFGHEGLRLEAIEDGELRAYRFQIQRGDKPAYDLSEGECSLVSFCYFMAKLEDADSKQAAPIVYIDDPVSSLDSNHIFFVFSLIEDLVARPIRDGSGAFEQLFVSTHNLEFLKYLKRLSLPKKDNEHFLVIGKSQTSTIELMPGYLRNYVTEFNYLFEEIYTCSNSDNATSAHHCFYNFGNNLRKFLEAFLFFKYPATANDSVTHTSRIVRFFEGDQIAATLVKRLTHEFSHLGGVFDRSAQPIDHAEISKMATFVLKKIKDNDAAQFACLLDSIGKPDPFDGELEHQQ